MLVLHRYLKVFVVGIVVLSGTNSERYILSGSGSLSFIMLSKNNV